MKKMNFWLLASLFMGAVAFTACSSSDDPVANNPTSNEEGITPGNPVNPGTMKMAALSGFVKDNYGNALSGVKVKSGTEEVTTGGDGGFMLTKVNAVNGRTIVNLTKNGYIDVVRSMDTKDGAIMDVVMTSGTWNQDYYSNSYPSTSSQTATMGGMSVGLQSNGYKNNSTGNAYNGYVTTKAFYLSPDVDNFAAMMPGGDLAAQDKNNEQVQLVSYGMVKVDLTDNSSNKLQLADGKPATLKFPIPEKFKDNPEPTMPLWSFNETTGLWVEEGTATLVGDHYEGTVTHFSWVNLDYPEKRATLKVIVKDNQGNIVPNVKVDIDGQREVFTNINGEAETFVPINQEIYVVVHSADYGNYDEPQKSDWKRVTLSPAGSTKTVELTLPKLAHISGKVTNIGQGSNFASLWIVYDGNKETRKVHSDVNGQFYMNAPANNQEVDATLKVRANDGSLNSYEIKLDGQDHAYNINITTGAENGGVATATLKENGTAYNITVPTASYESMDGVTIIDDILACNVYSGEYPYSSNYYLTIDNYKEGTQVYNGISFSFNENNGNNYMHVSDFNDNGTRTNKATVTTTSDGLFRFQIEGDAGFNSNGIQGGNKANATIKADVTAPLLARGKNLGKISAKDASFPSITPWIDGKTTSAALQITESKRLGKGVVLAYLENKSRKISYADYLNLKTQAQAQLGKPVFCGDYEDSSTPVLNEQKEQGGASATFAKGNKFIMINYCGWNGRTEEEADQYNEDIMIDLNGMGHHMMEMFKLSVVVLDGMTIDYNSFTNGGKIYVKGERNWEPAWKAYRK